MTLAQIKAAQAVFDARAKPGAPSFRRSRALQAQRLRGGQRAGGGKRWSAARLRRAWAERDAHLQDDRAREG
jgi:hypothetical protein